MLALYVLILSCFSIESVAQFKPEESAEFAKWEEFLWTADVVGQRHMPPSEGGTQPWELTLEKDGVTKEMMVAEWKANRETKGKVQLDKSGKTNQGGTVNRNKNYYGNPNGRNRRSVWTIASQPYSGSHFATFPPALVTPCILAGCPINGIILDPFGGSGTVGEVSEALGRNSILIELNPKYIELIEQRTKQQGLFT